MNNNRTIKSRQDVLAAYKTSGLSQKFCTVPFNTLLFEPDGLVGACRQKGAEFPVGNLQENSIQEIWNGPKIQAWRKEFLQGRPKICEREVRHVQCHSCPEYNYLLDAVEFDVVQKRMPSRIAFNLNGKCNLECQMCHIWQKPNGYYDTNGFWDNLNDLIQDLREVELLSGEPFIQKDTYKLIDRISEQKPNCQWIITTNANWKLTDTIKKHLDKIHFRNLIISLDSLDTKNYSIIRKKGNLNLALQTLNDLRDYERNRTSRGLSTLGIRINFMIQKTNWKELGAFHEFRKREGVDIFRTFLYEPFEYSLLSLNKNEKEEVLNYYFENLTKEQLSLPIILPILDSLEPIVKAQFLEKMIGLDS